MPHHVLAVTSAAKDGRDDEFNAHALSFGRQLLALPPHAVNYAKLSLNQMVKQGARPPSRPRSPTRPIPKA